MQQRPGRGVPPALSDAQLAVAWAQDDPLALGEVLRRYGGVLFGVAAALLDDRTVAADAVHDALVRAAARVGTLEVPARLPVWLIAVVRAEAAQRSLHPPAAGWTAAPALPAGRWSADGPARADGEAMRSASAALDERDREVLELVACGVTDGHDLADVLGVTARQAALLAADVQERLGVSLGALLVARSGGEGCPELAATLATQGPDWSGDVLALVVRHQQDCMDCRAVRSRLAPRVPPTIDALRHVPPDLTLGSRLVASLGPPAADRGVMSGPDAAPAGLSGRGWSWYPDGFPVQPPQPVRRVADVVADAAALAAAEAAAFAAVAAREAGRPGGRRRVLPVEAAVLVGIPLLVAGLVLSGLLPLGSPRPGRSGGSEAPGVVVAGAAPTTGGVPRSAGTVPGVSDAAGAPPAGAADPRTARATDVPTRTSGVEPTFAAVTGASPAVSAPVAGAADPQPGPEATTPAAGTPPRMPVSAPAADGATVSPSTVRASGGSDCAPLRATVTVPLDGSGVTGWVSWDNGRSDKKTRLVASGGALSASVGPFHEVGLATLTITLTTAAGSDTVTRSVKVVDCGHGG